MDRRRFLAVGALHALNAAGFSVAMAQGAGSILIARDLKSLSDGIRAAAGTPATVQVEGAIEISQNFTIPGNCSVVFSGAGKLVIGSDATMSIDGAIAAGNQRIFDGNGAVRGSAANGSVKCAWFGVIGDDATDNAQALLRMRDFLRHSSGPKTIAFSAGTYRYSRNEWVKGIRDLEINAIGARFLNISARAGWRFDEHPFVGNWGTFNSGGYGSYDASNVFFGYLIRSCKSGATALSCAELPADDHLKSGARVLIYGFGQQANSDPPNARYFEYNTVLSYDKAKATVRLVRPLRHDYDSRWHDFAIGKGAPRILPLDRPDYTCGNRLIINGGEFPQNPQHKGNAVQIQGYGSVELNHVKVHRLVPSMCENITVNECEIDNVESDKLIERLTFHGCNIATHYAATGVEWLSFTGGTRITRLFETAARNTVFDDVEFQSVGAGIRKVCLTLNRAYAQKTVVFKSARVVVDKPSIEAVMNGGGEVAFVVAAVLDGRTILVAATSDKQTEHFTKRMHQGFSYTLARGSKKCTVRNIYRHDSGNLAVEADFSDAPQIGETYRGGNIDLLRIERISQRGPFAPVKLVLAPFANNIALPG